MQVCDLLFLSMDTLLVPFQVAILQGQEFEVLNLLFGGVGFVYKSSEETECLCGYHLATVIFSAPSISESESELLLSLLSEGELYCAPVSFTCNVGINSV